MAARWRHRLAHAVGLRVAVWYAALFVVSASIIGLLAYEALASSLEQRDHDLLRVKLAEYAERYESGGLRALSVAVGAEQAAGGPDAVLVRLIGPDADLLLVSSPPAWQRFDFSQTAGPAAAANGELWQKVPSPSEDLTLEVVSRQLSDGTVIQVGRTTIGREQFLGQVRHVFEIMVLALLAAGLIGGVAITREGLRPLRELAATVGHIAHTGQLDARVPAHGDADLVDELGHVFNAMLTRIETLVAGMRGALDNVAHDLRTPVARLRARAEAALGSSDPDEARSALAECVEEADRVSALLTTLLDISEAETGTMQLTVDSVPVDALAADTIDLYEDIADERGVALTADVPAGLAVRGDRQRLRQVLANLVDNALKYTDRGGSVTVSAAPANGEVTMTVRDTGRGIAPEDLPRIWDRLYRADRARTERGLGLGLSLVRAIVSAHGGRADVTSMPGQGSTFRITLPAA